MPDKPVSSTAATLARADRFGHPAGLSCLFATEMWERFSYYGMRALLVLYMVEYLLQPRQAGDVIGLSWFRAGLESMFGPLAVQPLASQIYGFYTGLVYLTPIFGGLLADRLLGQRRTVVLGAALMAAGHFMMAVEGLFLFALLLLILGSGCFKPNISTQVGGLYAEGDRRRDRAFSIFYVGINLGAFFSPLVCGTLGETWGWHYGFSAAGVGMTVGLIIYLVATPSLPRDAFARRAAPSAPLGRADWQAIFSLVILVLPVSLFWATYEQQGNTIVLWSGEYTDRHLLGFEIPITWFQSLNPFMIFAFTPFIVALWRWQGAREPSTVVKMAIGCLLNAASWLIMLGAVQVTGDGPGHGQASWLWLFAFFFVITVGELYLSPTSLSLVTKVAPLRVLSLMMGVWLATSFFGNLLAGYLGTYWSSMGKGDFFLMLAMVSAAAGVVIALLNWPLRKILKD